MNNGLGNLATTGSASNPDRRAEEVESGGAGDHASVVADVAGAVTHGMSNHEWSGRNPVAHSTLVMAWGAR